MNQVLTYQPAIEYKNNSPYNEHEFPHLRQIKVDIGTKNKI